MSRLAIVFLVVIFTSCNDKDEIPTGILPAAKMGPVLWDVIRADVFTRDFIRKDSNTNATAYNVQLQQQIFAIHRITKDDFYRSYEFYKTRSDLMQPLLDSMLSKANRERYGTKPIKPIVPITDTNE